MSAPTTKREICGGRIEKAAASENSRRETAAASREISFSRIECAGASLDRFSDCGAPKDTPRPPEIETLCRAWRAAVTPARALPPYEELAWGSLGRLADSAALIRAAEPDKFDILMAGPTIDAWIDQPSRRLLVNQRSSGLVRALHDAVTRALKTKRARRSGCARRGERPSLHLRPRRSAIVELLGAAALSRLHEGAGSKIQPRRRYFQRHG